MGQSVNQGLGGFAVLFHWSRGSVVDHKHGMETVARSIPTNSNKKDLK